MRPNLPKSLLSGMLEGNMSLRCILFEMEWFFVVVELFEVLCLPVRGIRELNLIFWGLVLQLFLIVVVVLMFW